jgi:hypothetical protein
MRYLFLVIAAVCFLSCAKDNNDIDPIIENLTTEQVAGKYVLKEVINEVIFGCGYEDDYYIFNEDMTAVRQSCNDSYPLIWNRVKDKIIYTFTSNNESRTLTLEYDADADNFLLIFKTGDIKYIYEKTPDISL